jgi:hypothetical protein
MFKKIGYSPSPITQLSKDAVLADPVIIERMTKLAHEIKSLAAKSDDFLYFSIIFLKSAESALLDETGNLKKVGNDRAWGYFDEGWKWHGNVKPHRNNNFDIFPEIELKKAASKWIGMPLCKDHESSSVDGIRGIILDTYYDDKMKQVVGLCALDRVNYADLARKVETGIVRYGSMGTAVETSVCSDCQNFAKTANEYCSHVKGRTAWGEVNVGLKPIEYSLVVQPAEPGAILLRCIASLQDYKKEFSNYGVQNFDEMLGKLSLDQAQHLNTIVKTACGEDGCSPSERRKIITSFLKNNSLGDSAVSSNQNLTSVDATAVRSTGEGIGYNTDGVSDYTGTSGDKGTGIAVSVGLEDSSEGKDPMIGGGPVGSATPDIKIINASQNNLGHKKAKSLISTIMEDIMTESQLKKRAELRRALAYHQGGADGVEPTGTYKSKPFSHNEDKHMKQTKTMGGKETLFPGDQQKKEKLSRADLEERQMRRVAYFQGGSEKAAEPAGYKSKPFSHNEDKHMKQTKSMGGKETLFPGDEKTKQTLKRAAYNGPSLSTKLSWPVSPAGGINKSAALFEVYAGDKKVIAATGHEIFGNEVGQNWEWFTSKQYGQEVCKQIRTAGLNQVAALLKGAQAMDPAAPVPPPADMSAPPAPPMPDMGPMPGMEEEMDGSEDKKSPKEEVEESLTVMESEIDKVRKALQNLAGGEDVNVNVNVGQDGEEEGGSLKLSHSVALQLKTALAEMNESADELAMIAETYEGAGRLSADNRRELDKIATASLREASSLIGQSTTLTKMARTLSLEFTKVAKVAYAEDETHMNMKDHAKDNTDMMHDGKMMDDMDDDSDKEEIEADDSIDELMSKAMDLRRIRREQLVVEAAKKADPKMAAKMKALREKKDKEKQEDDAKDMKAKAKAKAEKAAEKEEAAAEKEKAEKAGKKKEMSKSAGLRDMVNDAFQTKKAEDEKDSYKIKLRRAYDVAIEMQKKGLLSISKTALDKQVDDIMDFDDKAFEAFKRSVASARPVETIKIARDLGGLNVGVESSTEQTPSRSTAELLSMLWE